MELKVLRCPNCGAHTTDHNNCEYCGSLLVRFADKGIDVDTGKFATDATEYPGLLAELKRNLNLKDKTVSTDIMWSPKSGEFQSVSILRTENGTICWLDGKEEKGLSKSGLTVVFAFILYKEPSIDHDYNRQIEEQIAEFKQQKAFSLSIPHTCTSKDGAGNERICNEYAIDFGQDAEGAAVLIGEVLKNVYKLAPSDDFDIFTNAGLSSIDEARAAWFDAHGIKTSSSVSILAILWWGLIILGVIKALFF